MAVSEIARGAGTQLRVAGTQIKHSGTFLKSAGAHVNSLRLAAPGNSGWPDGFYEAPSRTELARHRPGELIRQEPMTAYLLPGVRFNARALRILYRSTGAVGEPTAVSGTVLVPEGRRGPLSLVGYAPGTHGIGDGAAPSRLLSSGRDWEASPISQVLARGFAVAISDYQGLGTAGDHTFMVGSVLGRNVLDAMRAAVNAFPQELSCEVPAAVIGYSEGGTAAAWAAQLHPTYAPELHLAAVAAGAATGDMRTAVGRLDGHFGSFFLTYGAIGYAAAYPELELEPHLTVKGAKHVEALRESNLFQAVRHGPRFTHSDELTKPNVLQLPAWQKRLAQNRLGTVAPQAPVLLHHARHDQIISPEQSRRLQSDWASLGADVELRFLRGGLDHITGGMVGGPFALAWIAERLGQTVLTLTRPSRERIAAVRVAA